MIRLPIKLLTPPVRITPPKTSTQSKPGQTSKPPSASQTAHKPTTGGSQTAAAQTPDIPSFESLFQTMLNHYIPETVEFTPLDEDVLSETIKNWLRPAYEQAIRNRREQTERINAELDADAWSRGMGNSTYLTDVKERQYRGESRDVDTLESNYAAELAGHLYDAMKAQQETKIEVDRFNAEQINHSREQAMEAAQALYNAFLSLASKTQTSAGGGHGTSSAAGASNNGSESSLLSQLLEGGTNVSKTDYRTIANMVARMSPQERSRLYNRNDPKYLTLRSEILWSLTGDEYAKLMRTFPGA